MAESGQLGGAAKKPRLQKSRWVRIQGYDDAVECDITNLPDITDHARVNNLLKWCHQTYIKGTTLESKAQNDLMLQLHSGQATPEQGAGRAFRRKALSDVPGGTEEDPWLVRFADPFLEASSSRLTRTCPDTQHLVQDMGAGPALGPASLTFDLDQETDQQRFLQAALEKYAVKDRFRNPNVFRSHMHFEDTQEREDAFAYLLDLWRQLYEKKKKGAVNEKRAREDLIALPAAPGAGKTRMAGLVAGRGRGRGGLPWVKAFQAARDSRDKKFKKGVQEAVAITVDFNSGSEPQLGEETQHMVGVRLLYSHLCRGGFVDFMEFLKEHGCQKVSSDRALQIIRHDMTQNGLGDRHIIVVVDETLAAVDMHMKTPRRYKAALGTLCSSIGCLIDASRLNHVLVTALSGEALRDAMTPASKRSIVYVENFRLLTPKAITQLVKGDANRNKMLSYNFQAVLQETLGLPRLVEAVFLAADTHLAEGSPCDTIRESAAGHFAHRAKYGERSLRSDALLAAFAFECANNDRRTQRAKRARLAGYLFEDKIPPLLLRWWANLERQAGGGVLDAAHVILRAVVQICEQSDVRAPAEHGAPFEKQLANMLRIATVINWDWRGGATPRSILGVLGKQSSVDIANSAAPVPMWDDESAAYNMPLKEVSMATLSLPFADLKANADLPPSPVRGMIYFPKSSQNPGFDFLMADCLCNGKLLVTLVESKFSSEKAQTVLTTKEIVDKFQNALAGRPGLRKLFDQGRLVYIVGGWRLMQRQNLRKRAELIAKIARALKTSRPRVARSLLLLTRRHTCSLFTPTLSDLVPFRNISAEPSSA